MYLIVEYYVLCLFQTFRTCICLSPPPRHHQRVSFIYRETQPFIIVSYLHVKTFKCRAGCYTSSELSIVSSKCRMCRTVRSTTKATSLIRPPVRLDHCESLPSPGRRTECILSTYMSYNESTERSIDCVSNRGHIKVTKMNYDEK